MRQQQIVLAALVAAVAVSCVFAQPAPEPACYSSADAQRYLNTDLTIAVQPSSPVLVQRYQAPFIRIFCIMFTETGPACSTSSASTPILCSRVANDPTQPFSCELLSKYVTDSINTYTERGSVNGPDMIWDLMWDGTAEGPSCYPRAVNFRALILVSSATVSSPVVFAFMLILALLGFFFIIFVLTCFVVQRYRRIDEAGAVTIGGPKPSFQGPQLAVGPNNAPLGDGVDKVYLPVNENGAMVTDQSAAEYGAMQSMRGTTYGTPAIAGRRGPRRASPPAPGDGLPGGSAQFRGAQRTVFGLNSSDEEMDSDGDLYYIDENGARRYRRDDREVPPGGSGIRRRNKRGKKNGGGRKGAGGGDEKEMSFATLFPTEDAWNTNGDGEEYIDEDGNEISVEEARRRGMRPPRAFGASEHRVKYIPQWQMGSFGRGGMIPEIGDGYEDEVHQTQDGVNREIGKEKRTARAFGRYATPNQGLRRRPDGTLMDESEGYISDGKGGRRAGGGGGGGRELNSPFGRRGLEDEGLEDMGAAVGGGRRRTSPGRRGILKRTTDSGNELSEDAYGAGGPSGPARRRRASAAREGRGFNPDGGALAETARDNFNRNSATVFSPKLDLPNRQGNGAVGSPTGRNSGAPGGDDAKENNAFSFLREGPAPVLQCARCKVLLGTGNDEPFCPVDGHRHF